MKTRDNKNQPIDYQTLLEDIRHELVKVYYLDMNPAFVLDAIDIIIHEQTGLPCVADTTKRCEPVNDLLSAKCDFVVLSYNRHDPSSHGPIEAWAYQGPLNFDQAKPLVFGAGKDPVEAFAALTMQLKDARPSGTTKPVERKRNQQERNDGNSHQCKNRKRR